MNKDPSYLAVDLELASHENLSRIVKYFGDNVLVHLNQWVDGMYQVALGQFGEDENPESDSLKWCDALDSLPAAEMALLKGCVNRVLNIGFEGDNGSQRMVHILSETLIQRIAKLDLGIIVTVYPPGSP